MISQVIHLIINTLQQEILMEEYIMDTAITQKKRSSMILQYSDMTCDLAIMARNTIF